MTKTSMDSESATQQTSVKKKWVGNPLNNSDIGYDSEWDFVVPQSTTGPFNPVKPEIKD